MHSKLSNSLLLTAPLATVGLLICGSPYLFSLREILYRSQAKALQSHTRSVLVVNNAWYYCVSHSAFHDIRTFFYELFDRF